MKEKCVIIDIDGCLCDSSEGIKKYILKESKDFNSFRKEFINYPVFEWCKTLNNELYKKYKILILTARRNVDDTEKDTKSWLLQNGILYDKLIMRGTSEFSPGHEIKKKELKEIKKEYEVVFAIDDDPEINKMYKEEGIICLQPNNNLY